MYSESNESNDSDLDSALAEFERMLRDEKPGFFDSDTLEEIIDHYESKDHWDKALLAINYALERYPYSPLFLVKKAGILLFSKKFSEASALLDRAEQLDASELSLYLIRSDMFLCLGKHSEAIAVIRKAIKMIPSGDELDTLYLEMADIYEDCDDYPNVFLCLKEALKLNPQNEEALTRIWYCVEFARNFSESIDFHISFLEDEPYSYLAWHNLGRAYAELGMSEKALESFQFVTAINEDWDIGYRSCGEMHFELKEYYKAIEQFELAIETSKPYEDLYLNIGICLSKLKEYIKARSFFRKALAIFPKYDDAFYQIGVTYTKEKNWKQAVHFYKRALHYSPSCEEYAWQLAYAFFRMEDKKGFIEASAELVEIGLKNKRIQIFKKIIPLFFKLNLYSEANSLIDELLAFYPENVSLLYFKSITLYLSKKRKASLQILQVAVTVAKPSARFFETFAPEMLRDEMAVEILSNS
jgi:tetratricopeptide (TPR) repeat protein